MAYGDGHNDAVAREIADLLRKSQVAAKAREQGLVKSNYNGGLHTAAMLVHARWTATTDDQQRVLLEEIERMIENAKVSE